MLLCGDFRQILPVIQGSTRGNIVDCCLKKSFLWEHVVVKHLHTNMRVHLHGDEIAGEFADQLLAIGDGKYPPVVMYITHATLKHCDLKVNGFV